MHTYERQTISSPVTSISPSSSLCVASVSMTKYSRCQVKGFFSGEESNTSTSIISSLLPSGLFGDPVAADRHVAIWGFTLGSKGIWFCRHGCLSLGEQPGLSFWGGTMTEFNSANQRRTSSQLSWWLLYKTKLLCNSSGHCFCLPHALIPMCWIAPFRRSIYQHQWLFTLAVQHPTWNRCALCTGVFFPLHGQHYISKLIFFQMHFITLCVQHLHLCGSPFFTHEEWRFTTSSKIK